jgi:hypothetical protein
VVQDARGAGPHVDPTADFGQLVRLLVDLDIEAGLMQGHRGGEATEAAADDGDSERRDTRLTFPGTDT